MSMGHPLRPHVGQSLAGSGKTSAGSASNANALPSGLHQVSSWSTSSAPLLMNRIAILCVAHICQQLGIDRYHGPVLQCLAALLLQRVEQQCLFLARLLEASNGLAHLAALEPCIEDVKDPSDLIRPKDSLDGVADTSYLAPSLLHKKRKRSDAADSSNHPAFHPTSAVSSSSLSLKTPYTLKHWMRAELGFYDSPGFLDHFNYLVCQKRWLKSLLKRLVGPQHAKELLFGGTSGHDRARGLMTSGLLTLPDLQPLAPFSENDAAGSTSGQALRPGRRSGAKDASTHKRSMFPSEAILALLKSVPKISSKKQTATMLAKQQARRIPDPSAAIGTIHDHEIPNVDTEAPDLPESLRESLSDCLDMLPPLPSRATFSESSLLKADQPIFAPQPLSGNTSCSSLAGDTIVDATSARSSPLSSMRTNLSSPVRSIKRPSSATTASSFNLSQPLLPLTLNLLSRNWLTQPSVSAKSFFSDATPSIPNSTIMPSPHSMGVGTSLQTSTTQQRSLNALDIAMSLSEEPSPALLSSSSASLPSRMTKASSTAATLSLSSSSAYREIASSPFGQSLPNSTSAFASPATIMTKIFESCPATFNTFDLGHDLDFLSSIHISSAQEEENSGPKTRLRLLQMLPEDPVTTYMETSDESLLDYELKASTAALCCSIKGDKLDGSNADNSSSTLWNCVMHALWMHLIRQRNSTPSGKMSARARVTRVPRLEFDLTEADVLHLKKHLQTSALASTLTGTLWASQIDYVAQSVSLHRIVAPLSFDAALPSSVVASLSQFHFPSLSSPSSIISPLEETEFESLTRSSSGGGNRSTYARNDPSFLSPYEMTKDSRVPSSTKASPSSASAGKSMTTLMTQMTSLFPVTQSLMISGWNGMSHGSILQGWYMEIMSFAKSRFLMHEDVIFGKSVPYLFATLPPSLLPSYASSTVISIPRKLSISKPQKLTLPLTLAGRPPTTSSTKLSKQWAMMRNKLASRKLVSMPTPGARPLQLTMKKKPTSSQVVDVVVVTPNKSSLAEHSHNSAVLPEKPLLKFSNTVLDKWKSTSTDYKIPPSKLTMGQTSLSALSGVSPGMNSVGESKIRQLSTGRYVLQTGKVGRPKLVTLPKILLPNIKRHEVEDQRHASEAHSTSSSDDIDYLGGPPEATLPAAEMPKLVPRLKLNIRNPFIQVASATKRKPVARQPRKSTKKAKMAKVGEELDGYQSGEAFLSVPRVSSLTPVIKSSMETLIISEEEDIDVVTVRDSPKKLSPSASSTASSRPLSLKLKLSASLLKREKESPPSTPQSTKSALAVSSLSSSVSSAANSAESSPSTTSAGAKLPKLKLVLRPMAKTPSSSDA